MANLGNAWHIPQNPEPRGRGAMRDPAGAIVPGMDITVFTGNEFRGDGNPGNQLQTGSSLLVKVATAAGWDELPLTFYTQAGNNKYFAATIPAHTTRGFAVGETVAYYMRIAYDDHDTTFLHADGRESAAAADESIARAQPFTFTVQDPAEWGLWGPVFNLPNVAIHTHVLPNGRVLMWGRRERSNPDLDVQSCTPFVWDPNDALIAPNPDEPTGTASAKTVNTAPPVGQDGTPVNLFCSGHAFLPDGRLLVVGGHRKDSDGLNQVCTYTPAPADSDQPGTWTPLPPMGPGNDRRRWYPTATALPDGAVLVLSGSYWVTPDGKNIGIVALLQVWRNERWETITKQDGAVLDFRGLPLYPRMHVISDGRVVMAGTNATTYLLKTTTPGGWTPIGARQAGVRDYCPSVMFDQDKILYIGGGNDAVAPDASPDEPRPPTAHAEVIAFGATPARWRDTAPMHFPRRQHNAVLLPDGTVLVTGGTRGGGGARPAQGVAGFNDLRAGQPVHAAELWDPKAANGTGAWKLLAAEAVDRCYHSTAVLLPDGRVLSAGGGEYRPDDLNPNDPDDTHPDAQIFSPPYLFRGDRPTITSAPTSVQYGQAFRIATAQANAIEKVRWLRLPSVTHAFDQNQRVNFLTFTADSGTVTVTAPDSRRVCPPGHYMLFVLTASGVPSKAVIIQLHDAVTEPSAATHEEPCADAGAQPSGLGDAAEPAGAEYGDEAVRRADATVVLVGINGTCPYGIGACWAGAYEALRGLSGVGSVNPVPDTGDLTAQVYMTDERLPDLNAWAEQFRRTANGTYRLRGFEVTVRGVVEERQGQMYLRHTQHRPDIQLVALSTDKVQWDAATDAPQRTEPAEAAAYGALAAAGEVGVADIAVTGPLVQTQSGYRLHVRAISVTPQHGQEPTR